MLAICLAFCLFAYAHSATVVPVQTSQVDVRRSGGEFSYNIQENHGVAAIGDHVQPIVQPIVKAVHFDPKPGVVEHVKEKHEEHHQDAVVHHADSIVHPGQKVEGRAYFQTKELKKPEEVALISQPIVTSPLEYYGFYYPFSTFPKASFISPINGFPFPYTFIRTV